MRKLQGQKMDKASSHKPNGDSSCTCIQMDTSSNSGLFMHHKDHLKPRSPCSGANRTCILSSLLCIVLVISLAALLLSAVALWFSADWKARIDVDTNLLESKEMEDEALYQVCSLYNIGFSSLLEVILFKLQ